MPEEEVLIWLALGAAAQREGRALLRPVVHAFVRGVAGGVVTFPLKATSARLALSAEEVGPDEQGLFRLPLMTCTTCGQHYFVHHVRDFTFTDRAPGGGEAVENRVIWRPLEEQLGGDRIVFLDRLVVDATDDDDDDDAAPPPQPQLRAPAPEFRSAVFLPLLRHSACRPRRAVRWVREAGSIGGVVRHAAKAGAAGQADFVRGLQRDRPHAVGAVPRTGSPGEGECRFRRARAGAEYDPPCGAEAAASLLR